RGAAGRRPDPGHARGTAGHAVRPRRRLGGEDHVGGDRPAPGAGPMSTTLAPPREPSGAPADVSSRRLTGRGFRVRESGIIVVLVLFVLITALIEPRFVSSSNIQFILINTSVYALVALGETMVIISRNVDLSVQSVLALSAYLSAGLFGHVHGIPI